MARERLALPSQRKEFTQPGIAQPKSSPDQQAENGLTDEWIADAHMSGDRAAKITCQQNRSKNGGLRNQIDDRTGQFDDPKAEQMALVPSEIGHSLHDSI